MRPISSVLDSAGRSDPTGSGPAEKTPAAGPGSLSDLEAHSDQRERAIEKTPAAGPPAAGPPAAGPPAAGPKPTALLVLGLGNLLCGDDGVGPAAVARLLRRYEVPEGVCVLDGGTLGLSLLPYIEDAEQVLLVDAIRAEQPPGSLVRLEGDEVAGAVAARLSVHQVGVADLLDAARWRGRYPSRLTLLGLVPETLELGLQQSPPVAAQLALLVDRIVTEARDLGYEFHPKASDETNLSGSACNVARAFGLS